MNKIIDECINIIVENQKIINLLDKTKIQSSKFWTTKKWFEINDESKGKYDNRSIRLKYL